MTISPLQTSIIPPFNVNLVLSDGKIQNIMAARHSVGRLRYLTASIMIYKIFIGISIR